MLDFSHDDSNSEIGEKNSELPEVFGEKTRRFFFNDSHGEAAFRFVLTSMFVFLFAAASLTVNALAGSD